MSAVPFMDLRLQYQTIATEINESIKRVVESGSYILGPEVLAFEEAFAKFCNSKFCVAVNSGTSALHLALLACGIKPGDEVITVSASFVATTAAIDYSGGIPIFVDVDEKTLTIDVKRIENVITNRTKAIVPVHLHGHPCNMTEVMKIARKYNLKVIEDAAQAHGAKWNNEIIGSIGDVGCFSFYPGKNLGAYGEGGAVTTSDEDLYKRILRLRDWGQEKKYNHVQRGFNYRMDAIQGAILNIKLKSLPEWTEARKTNALAYKDRITSNKVSTPSVAPEADHVYHVFAVRTDFRDKLQEYLSAFNIGTGIHYPIPIHLQKAYSDFGAGTGSLPVTEQTSSQLLSLPMFPELSISQIDYISELINKFVPS